MFVLDADIPKAVYILDWLVKKICQSGSNSRERANQFKVYSLDKLVYEVRRYADVNNPRLKFSSTLQVADKLNNGTFEFCSACQVFKLF